MRYLHITLIFMFLLMHMSLGAAMAQHQPWHHPQPQAPAPPPSQRIPVSPPGIDVNAKPGLPSAILDTLRQPITPAGEPVKVKLPAPGSIPTGLYPRRAISPEAQRALQADMQSLRQWYQGEQAKLRQQWINTLQDAMVQTTAKRQALLSQLQVISRQWAALKPVARQRPAQLQEIRNRLNQLNIQVKSLEAAQQGVLQDLNRQFAALAQTYLSKQEDLISKHYQPDNFTGAPMEDFAMTHFQ
jgi:hypothetical protein